MKFIKCIIGSMLLVTMGGCAESPDKSAVFKGEVDSGELKSFNAGVIDNFIYVEGGSFLMGNFGVQFGFDKIQCDGGKDSKPLH